SWSGLTFRWPAWRPSGPALRTCSSSSPVRASMSTVSPASTGSVSAGAAKPTSPASTPAQQLRHWLRLFRSELRIVYLRPRNLAMFAVLAAAPIFLGIVLKINTPPPGAGGPSGAGEFIGQVAENG